MNYVVTYQFSESNPKITKIMSLENLRSLIENGVIVTYIYLIGCNNDSPKEFSKFGVREGGI